jgi:tetratricopeptide (TPR) repeat protein
MTTAATPVEIAFGLLREGRLADAEELMARELRDVTARDGQGSSQWASAQCDLGNVLLNADQVGRAVECYRSAASVHGTDHETRKDQLTYRLNLGLALQLAGRLDEADAELRQGLAERLAFYGRDHAGYAFGLEPLARLLLLRGDLREARVVADEAVANLQRNRNERVAEALGLRAAIIQAAGADEPPFPDLDQLPDDLVRRVAQAALQQAGRGGPAAERLVTSLAAALETRLGPDDQAVLNALSVLANLRADLGEHAGRVEAIERVLAAYDRQGRDGDALMASLGLAMAQDQAGDAAAGLRTYAATYARADRLDRPELRSQVLRNWGLALKEAGDASQAEQRLTEAVAQARRGADHETLGRAGVALGIFLQHEERLDEASAVLREALGALPPAHRDAVVGRSHLGAAVNGRTCGCDGLPDAVADAFREFVLSRLPPDLLARLDVTIADNDFQIGVHLQREPTPDELDRLNGVVQSALAEFRRKLTAPRYAG